MIVASLLLILVAVTLLVLGLTGGSSILLISSIVASLLAAVTLVIGARQAAALRRSRADAADAFGPREPEHGFAEPEHGFAEPERGFAGPDLSGSAPSEPAESHSAPTGDVPAVVPPRETDAAVGEAAPDDAGADRAAVDGTAPDDAGAHEAAVDEAAVEGAAVDDPADEPDPQIVTAADAVRVARLDTEVLVVDGRPRYHLADCPHLVGRRTEPIGVNEAVELGFSPCGVCRPVDRLVAASAHR